MPVTLNGEILAHGTVVEIAQDPPQFEVFEDDHGWGIRFLWPDNPGYKPVEHYAGRGVLAERVEVPLFNRDTQVESTGVVLISGK